MRWLMRIWRRLFPRPDAKSTGSTQPQWARSTLLVRRHIGRGPAPAMHWKACHPLTVKRFKAEMACIEGHSLVLSSHRIAADGTVSPSVVCQTAGCAFHDFVRLDDWTDGPLG